MLLHACCRVTASVLKKEKQFLLTLDKKSPTNKPIKDNCYLTLKKLSWEHLLPGTIKLMRLPHTKDPVGFFLVHLLLPSPSPDTPHDLITSFCTERVSILKKK